MTAIRHPSLLLFGAAAPRGASAQSTSCTDTYLLCINEAEVKYDDGSWWNLTLDLAYTECGSEYAGCVRKKLLGI